MRLAADDSVDDCDQGVHALIAALGIFDEFIHFLAELINTIGKHNLCGQQLPVLVPESQVILDQKLRIVPELPALVPESHLILDQEVHQSLHAIQPRFAVPVGAFFRHGPKLLSQNRQKFSGLNVNPDPIARLARGL
jgi:hypothetical protein